MPVKHIVMFTLQDGVAPKLVTALKDGLLSLPKVLPAGVVSSYELGEDLLLPNGQNHPAGKNRSIVWSVVCPSVDDYVKYETSPEHIDVVNTKIKPITVPGSRAAIQYEF